MASSRPSRAGRAQRGSSAGPRQRRVEAVGDRAGGAGSGRWGGRWPRGRSWGPWAEAGCWCPCPDVRPPACAPCGRLWCCCESGGLSSAAVRPRAVWCDLHGLRVDVARRWPTSDSQSRGQRGSDTVNVVSPGSDETGAVPPWACDDRGDQGEPEPGAAGGAGARGVAAGEPLEGVVGEAGGQAGAVVVDRDRGPRRRPRTAETVTVVPGGVWCRALPSRLVTTWCSRCSSPMTVTGSSGSSQLPRWSGASTRASATDSSSSRVTSTSRALQRPAGVQPGEQQQVLDEARTSGRSRSRPWPAPWTRAAGSSGVRRDSSAYPWIVASGVRSSCEASATNCRTCSSLRCRAASGLGHVLEQRVQRGPTWPTSVARRCSGPRHPLVDADVADSTAAEGHGVRGRGDLVERSQLSAYDDRARASGRQRTPSRASSSSSQQQAGAVASIVVAWAARRPAVAAGRRCRPWPGSRRGRSASTPWTSPSAGTSLQLRSGGGRQLSRPTVLVGRTTTSAWLVAVRRWHDHRAG